MIEKITRREMLRRAGAAGGALAVGGMAPALAKDPRRPLLYGAGIIWGRWVNLPRDYDDRQMDLLKSLGGTVCSASFDWVDVERTPGKWDWSYADHTVDAAQKRKLKQIAFIGNTARWALPTGVSPNLTYRFPPRDNCESAFYNYCRTAAARYRGRVEMFQFWNEPNGCGWVKDGCANADQFALYTRWLKVAYAGLKAGNPHCIVAAGALDYNQGVKDGYKYIEGMYKNGAYGHFDTISIHPYGEPLHWEALSDTHRVMSENGDSHKGIWITEYGWSDSKGEGPAEKLREVLRRLSTPEFSYVKLANYLCVTDLPGKGEQYGLADRDLHPRPIAMAFREMATGAQV